MTMTGPSAGQLPAGMTAHPAADMFPLVAGAEYDELVGSIRASGLREAIWLDVDGLVLDGRNRLRACIDAGVEPRFRTYEGDDPWQFVYDLNYHRRHLTESQRAMAAARYATSRRGRPTADKGANLPLYPDLGQQPTITNAEAAAKFNVSERTVKSGRKVIDQGVPELVDKVGHGDVAVSAAAGIAELEPETQREVIDAGDGKAIRDAYRREAERTREQKRAAIVAKLEDIETREAKTAQGVYDVIVIDPPWPMKKIERDVRPNQVEFDYPTMTEDELRGLNIPTADDCHVWVWTTHKFLPMALRLLDAWSLRYVCTFVWHKPGGFQPIGLPQYNAEFALYARRGSPQFVDTKAFPVCFEAPRGAHSEKPGEFYDTIRRTTGGRRLDMFNRRPIEGFDTWGNEASE